MTKTPIKDAVVKASRGYNFQPEVIFSLIYVESGGNPYAVRFEPAFLAKYLTPKKGETLAIEHSPLCSEETERHMRSTSFGLTQVLGQTAREIGYPEPFLTSLFDIEANVEMGARILRYKVEKKDGDLKKGLLAYNGGADKDYPMKVITTLEKGLWEFLLLR